MGERFQSYVNYGKNGDNLHAMHLQWCWGPFSIIRAHQLVSFLDGAREDHFNPFGLGEHSRAGAAGFDGRRKDLSILRSLTELNLVSCTTVPGHDLMTETNEWDEWRFKEGKITSFPETIRMDPLAQDNNHGFLVVKATPDEVKYAFCKDADAIEPVGASEYFSAYQDERPDYDESFNQKVDEMIQVLDQYPLLTESEITHIFERDYAKDLNVENFQMPELIQVKEDSLDDLLHEAQSRLEASKAQPDTQSKHQAIKRTSEPSL